MSEFGNILLTDEVKRKVEKFICTFYTTNQKAGHTANSVRHWMFCQKGLKSEALPPTSDSLAQHIKRANYQTHIWRKALEPMQNASSPDGHGWELRENHLYPVLMAQLKAPKAVAELAFCKCKISNCSRASCACHMNQMPCTEACGCMGDETCQNSLTKSAMQNDDQSDMDG